MYNPPFEGLSSTALRGAAATARQALDARATFVSVAGPDGLTITVHDNGQQRVDHDLSDRELEVLDLLTAGASNAGIADQLVIVEATAKERVRNIRRKLGASSRLEAMAQARRAGLL